MPCRVHNYCIAKLFQQFNKKTHPQFGENKLNIVSIIEKISLWFTSTF